MRTEMKFSDQFLLLEEFGRMHARDARLKIRYLDETSFQSVTLGLPHEIYRLVYRPDEIDDAILYLIAGSQIAIHSNEPGQFEISSPVIENRFADMISRSTRLKEWRDYPLMYHLEHPKSVDLIARSVYRAASKIKAELYISTIELEGRLEHVIAPWMLDTYEKPQDVYVRKDSQWALYHTHTQCAFESSNWFFEATGLFHEINL